MLEWMPEINQYLHHPHLAALLGFILLALFLVSLFSQVGRGAPWPSYTNSIVLATPAETEHLFPRGWDKNPGSAPDGPAPAPVTELGKDCASVGQS